MLIRKSWVLADTKIIVEIDRDGTKTHLQENLKSAAVARAIGTEENETGAYGGCLKFLKSLDYLDV